MPSGQYQRKKKIKKPIVPLPNGHIVIEKLSDIIPLMKDGDVSLAAVGRMLNPARKPSTMWRYVEDFEKQRSYVLTTRGRSTKKWKL